MVEAQALDFIVIGMLGACLYLVYHLKLHLVQIIDELDHSLAAALQATIAQVAENIEPPNPFQQLIHHWLAEQSSTVKVAAEVLERDSQGRYTKKD